ncbi:MAG: sigma 54-interacting transcriptional regulator [Dehalobacterium sp.]
MGYLFKIQKDVQSIAEVISAALKLETEIVDEDYIVLGATGRIRGLLLHQRLSDSHINRYVLENKSPFVLTKPGQHKMCAPCSERDDCYYLGGIYYPIKLKEKCYGVISLVGFNEIQKELLINNQNTFLDFTGKMADLLATKLQEVMMMEELCRANEYLETIINSVYEGIISCDQNGIITCFNQRAVNNYGIPKEEALGKHISSIIPNSLLNKALLASSSFYEEKIQCKNAGGETINLISNTTIIKEGDRVLGAVESFTPEESIYRVAFRLTNQEQITALDNIIGNSQVIKRTKKMAFNVAQTPSTILITGESGTGKELFARAIHKASHRAKEPFIPINCSAIPDSLLESELFGYEKGAFTGAKNDGKPGLFELAKGGTIFLDEIGDMPLHLQVKILRVLQDKTIQKIGGTKNIPVDVRIIAATHQNLKEQIRKKLFREDLFYRLNVIPLNIPPLRERREDISLLVNYMCEKFALSLNKEIRGISQDTLAILFSYPWPGNVRELENAVEYAINFVPNGSVITKDYLPPWLGTASNVPYLDPENFKDKIQLSERQMLIEALETTGTSLKAKKQIARDLNIGLATLYRKLRKYGL